MWKLRAGGNSSLETAPCGARPQQPAVEAHEDLRERGRRVRHRRAGSRVAAVPGDASAPGPRAGSGCGASRRAPSTPATSAALIPISGVPRHELGERRRRRVQSDPGLHDAVERGHHERRAARRSRRSRAPAAAIASSMLGRRLVRARGRLGATRSEEHGPEDLHEAGDRQRAGHREQRSRQRRHGPRAVDAVAADAEQADVDQQLAHEAVERRQAADRRGADREERRGARPSAWRARRDDRSRACRRRGSRIRRPGRAAP